MEQVCSKYNNRKKELRRMFKLRELYRPENIEEKKRWGFSEEILSLTLGEPYPTERRGKRFTKN